MVVYEKIYLEAYINSQYIYVKIMLHNYIFRESQGTFEFSSLLRVVPEYQNHP